MTKILVCASDDPTAHLRALQARNSEWELQTASEWERLADILSTERPDLVVLDADTLPRKLKAGVEHVLAEGPDLPVVVIGSDWWHRSPVLSLGIGAASFVPKSAQARNLAATVERILALAARARRHSALQAHVVSTTALMQLDNDPAIVPALVSDVQDRVDQFPGWSDRELMRIGIAVEESVLNAIIHGNLEVSSALKEIDQARFLEQIEKRRLESMYGARRVEVELHVSQPRALIRVRDEGPGFDTNAIADPTDPQNLSKPSGRGVMLMRAFMDSVAYNQRGNEVVLTKFNAAAPQ